MLDVSRTRYQLTTNKYTVAGLSIQGILDGMGVVSVLEDGVQKAAVKATAAEGDVFLGIAFSQYRAQAQTTRVEEFTVPSGGGSVTLASAPVNGAERVTVSLNGGEFKAAQASAPSAAGQVQLVGNVMTFHADDAGKIAKVVYRYDLTVAELETVPFMGDGVPGVAVSAATDSISIIQKGEVFTDQFDTSVDWNNEAKDIVLGDNGIFTRGANAKGAKVNGVVCHVPTVDCPFLGIDLMI
jgi:hypothetical protein